MNIIQNSVVVRMNGHVIRTNRENIIAGAYLANIGTDTTTMVGNLFPTHRDIIASYDPDPIKNAALDGVKPIMGVVSVEDSITTQYSFVETANGRGLKVYDTRIIRNETNSPVAINSFGRYLQATTIVKDIIIEPGGELNLEMTTSFLFRDTNTTFAMGDRFNKLMSTAKADMRVIRAITPKPANIRVGFSKVKVWYSTDPNFATATTIDTNQLVGENVIVNPTFVHSPTTANKRRCQLVYTARITANRTYYGIFYELSNGIFDAKLSFDRGYSNAELTKAVNSLAITIEEPLWANNVV